jgi:hypothetical protein
MFSQKVQYNQKAQECQSLRIELSRVVTTPSVTVSTASSSPSNITSGFTRSASVAPTPPTSSASVAPAYLPHSGSTFLARIPAVPSSRSSTTVSPSPMLMSQEQPPPLPPGAVTDGQRHLLLRLACPMLRQLSGPLPLQPPRDHWDLLIYLPVTNGRRRLLLRSSSPLSLQPPHNHWDLASPQHEDIFVFFLPLVVARAEHGYG